MRWGVPYWCGSRPARALPLVVPVRVAVSPGDFFSSYASMTIMTVMYEYNCRNILKEDRDDAGHTRHALR